MGLARNLSCLAPFGAERAAILAAFGWHSGLAEALAKLLSPVFVCFFPEPARLPVALEQ